MAGKSAYMHIANLNIKQIPQDFCVESCAMKDSLFFFFFFFLDESQYGSEMLQKNNRWLHTCFPAANG